jgi:hypothetical protein
MSWDNIESICTIPADGYDELWLVVDRSNGRMIERMSLRDSYIEVDDELVLSATTGVFLDSAVTYNSASATVFDGLSHLEGEDVGVLADGEYLGTYLVSSASINLSSAKTEVAIGLPYYSDLQTLNINIQSKDGTLQGLRNKISNVIFRVLNTRGGWIGPDEDNLYEALTSVNLSSAKALNEPVGTSPAQLFNVDLRVPLGAQYTGYGAVFYRQKDPLPITILNVIPELSVGGPSSG